ncbi:ABC transporter substrate-binding protein [Tianweitania sediminis]|uniref:ABC transporter substrate-binding protein n=1 Tax=Tianweitania sediminis TaxID=1502156 RepID=A0A8J7UJM9_9HYPH|nr:ABC transporter substrate-binding protein [Tianweitania sediminis]MBP0440223.1 ABC transporter substrate-binding protein [Tianweitania sediminis]
MRNKLLALTACLLASTASYAADPGVSDTEIKIGDVNIMTGPASFIGRAVAVGSKIAAAEINEAGGVNGRKITIVTEDDGYIPARSFQALTKLIEVDEIFALNGTSGTANVLAMMPLIEENNLPTVVTTAPNELVYDPVRPSVFTIGGSYSDAFYGQLKYIHENLEPENPVYGLIRQDDDFGGAIEHGYERAIEEFGVKDGLRVRFKKGTANFAAEVAQMKQAGVNVLANGGIIAGAANILGEARKLSMDMQVASVWSEDMPPSVNLSAPAGYDYLVADYVALNGPDYDRFMEKARKYASEEEVAAINRYTLVTYVGLSALAEAMKQCGQELTRDCTIEKLRGLKNFDTQGVAAPISFDNEQQLSGTALAIYQLNAADKSFKRLTDFTDY